MPRSTTLVDNSNYFEAKIQLRPYDEEVLYYIIKRVDKREGVTISKVVKLKTGIDIYLSSQRFARALGDKMKKAFPKWELKVTRKLHTQDRLTSKKLYRATVLMRKKLENRE